MAANLRTRFSNAVCWMKNLMLWLDCHLSIFCKIQMAINQHSDNDEWFGIKYTFNWNSTGVFPTGPSGLNFSDISKIILQNVSHFVSKLLPRKTAFHLASSVIDFLTLFTHRWKTVPGNIVSELSTRRGIAVNPVPLVNSKHIDYLLLCPKYTFFSPLNCS